MKLLVVILVVLCASVSAQDHLYSYDGKAVLPNHLLTPGKANTALSKSTLCSKNFRTGSVRDVTEAQKKQVCKEYHQNTDCPGKGYEIDHLISIELGGSNDISNLWPEPVDRPGVVGYHTKDAVEDRSHAAMCSGKLTLQQAQDGISGDWYSYALKYNLLSKK